jgi:hypothetical protein
VVHYHTLLVQVPLWFQPHTGMLPNYWLMAVAICLILKILMALADIINGLLDDKTVLNELKENAYEYGLHLRWPVIGAEFIKVAQEAAVNHDFSEKILKNSIVDPEILPKFSLAHILRLTDDTGIVQHAKYGIPNLKEGYCLDDNARALIMALMAYQRNKSSDAFRLLPIYLSYIHYMQTDDGNFRNFLSFRQAIS